MSSPTLEGFMLPAILGEVRTSWKGRLEDVRAECTRLALSLLPEARAERLPHPAVAATAVLRSPAPV
ncbi:hypothetical protein [Streptomyces sp. NPDC059979]|uniref:hypothetical protein n=1 Tax=Streptomyces sp. NPDC059979 TaxID=3347021 RepID=UPI0036982B41